MNDSKRLLAALAGVALACEFQAQNGIAARAETQPTLTPGRVGQAVYQQHCAACHGVNGQGNGQAAVWLYPKPRHFDSGLFKIRSTPSSFLPTDEDLFQTITRGMPGSSMPSFTYLSEQERRDVVQYVQVHDAYPFYTDTGRLHSYSDDPTAISCGENFIVHREGPEATPYLPNVIVSSNPLVRPNDYGIPLNAEHWDERTVRNVKLSWAEAKKTTNFLWKDGYQFYCLTPK